MTNQLKPTNDEISNYIEAVIFGMDGLMLEVTDWENILAYLRKKKYTNLRSLFNPPMYNSIRDYVDNQEYRK